MQMHSMLELVVFYYSKYSSLIHHKTVAIMGARRHGQGGEHPPGKLKNKIKIMIKNFGALCAPNNNVNTIATLKL